MRTLNTIDELILNAKNKISSELYDDYSDKFLYSAIDDDSVSAGIAEARFVSFEEGIGIYSYELFSKDGNVYYSVCVYDTTREMVSFTGWYNVVNVSVEDFQKEIDVENYTPTINEE